MNRMIYTSNIVQVKTGYQLKLKPSDDKSDPEEFILSPLARRDSYYTGSVPKLAERSVAANNFNNSVPLSVM